MAQNPVHLLTLWCREPTTTGNTYRLIRKYFSAFGRYLARVLVISIYTLHTSLQPVCTKCLVISCLPSTCCMPYLPFVFLFVLMYKIRLYLQRPLVLLLGENNWFCDAHWIYVFLPFLLGNHLMHKTIIVWGHSNK
jgi:hypothetical protein